MEASLSVEDGVQVVRALATMKPRPTALLCLSDVMAMGALFEAPRQGLKIPDDLSVMGFDDLDWTPHFEPSLTTVHLPTHETLFLYEPNHRRTQNRQMVRAVAVSG